MIDAVAVELALADAHRREWAVVLAATACAVHDIDLAEECVQEAYASALVAWGRDGIPRNPAAWLTTTARRRAFDAARRSRSLRAKLPLLVEPEPEPRAAQVGFEIGDGLESSVTDERLRLIFLCCHPALAPDAQTALTLRLVCGMSTRDIARAFFVSEQTMGARLTRAKKKIAAARIPLRTPAAAELPDRLSTVLGVIHLVFTMGHTAPSGPSLMRLDLVDEALHLARVLHTLMPEEAEARGLLALLLATDARRATRVAPDGRPLRLAEQDRSRWDREMIGAAHHLIAEQFRGDARGRYALQAAIAVLHAEAPTFDATDWSQIIRYYDELFLIWPSPAVALNRAVAWSMVGGAAVALVEVERLERDGRLANSNYLFAVKAELLRRLGRIDDAAQADRRALSLATNDAERAVLGERLALP